MWESMRAAARTGHPREVTNEMDSEKGSTAQVRIVSFWLHPKPVHRTRPFLAHDICSVAGGQLANEPGTIRVIRLSSWCLLEPSDVMGECESLTNAVGHAWDEEIVQLDENLGSSCGRHHDWIEQIIFGSFDIHNEQHSSTNMNGQFFL